MDGRNGKRTGNTGHLRSLPVNNGHSKTASDLASHALIRSVGIERTPEQPTDGFLVEGVTVGSGCVRPATIRQAAPPSRLGGAATSPALRCA
jgi:hypothetical protein